MVIFIFAGRRANMEIQMPYLMRLLDLYPEAEVHLWDLTRDAADQRYLQGLEGAQEGRVHVLGHLHPGHPIRCANPGGRRGRRYPCACLLHRPPYERPYQYYASRYENIPTVYVKMDDDVLFLETERFNDLIMPLVDHPNRVISANVINNAVCAKYDVDLSRTLRTLFDPQTDRQWWVLHTSPEFARESHDWFLDNIGNGRTIASGYVRTRPGEQVSINCVAFTNKTMNRLARAFTYNGRLGDEGVIDSYLPWIARSFHAAHLTFGPQDKEMSLVELNVLRLRYLELSSRYLGVKV